MDFPRYVFKSPGPFQVKEGAYDHKLVEDQDDFYEALEVGWFVTITDAIMVAAEPPVAAVEAPAFAAVEAPAAVEAEEAPPTREEIETHARELGIKRVGNMSSETLLSKIAEAMAE